MPFKKERNSKKNREKAKAGEKDEEEKAQDSNTTKKCWVEEGRIDAKGLAKALLETAKVLRSGE